MRSAPAVARTKPWHGVAADRLRKGALAPFGPVSRHCGDHVETGVEEEPVDMPARWTVPFAGKPEVPLDAGKTPRAERRADIEVIPGPERDISEPTHLQGARAVPEDQAVRAGIHL